MARLQKFSGTQSLPGVGNPQVVADTAVASATAGLGQQIGRSADAIGRLAERRQKQIEGFEEAKAVRQHEQQLKEFGERERQKAPPGAFGYADVMLAGMDEVRENTLKGLPEQSKSKVLQQLDDRKDRYISSFAAVEAAENEKYFQRGIAEEEEFLIAEVRENPQEIDAAFERANGILRVAPLPARVKAEAGARIRENLTRIWVEALPPAEQISALEGEIARRGTSGSQGGSASSQTIGAGGETAERLQHLPNAALERLHTNALKTKERSAAREVDLISERIKASHGLFDISEIQSNATLAPHQKVALINASTSAKSEQRRNIEAVRWISTGVGMEVPAGTDQDLADRAFAFLDDGEADRDVLARGILQKKGILPAAYLSALNKDLESIEPTNVGRALDASSGLSGGSTWKFSDKPGAEPVQLALVKRDILMKGAGLKANEVAAHLARVNKPVNRKEFQANFVVEYRQNHNGSRGVPGLLDQLSSESLASKNALPSGF